MADEVVLYSARMCCDCDKLKDYLDAQGIEYELKDIREHPEYAQELEDNTGKHGVPYLVVNGEWKRGYELGKPFTEEFAKRLVGS